MATDDTTPDPVAGTDVAVEGDAVGAGSGDKTTGATDATSILGAAEGVAGQADKGTDGAEGEADEGANEGEGKESEPEGAPEKYEAFEMPEGMQADSVLTTAFEATAKKLNLSQSQAQSVISELMPVMEKRGREQIAAVSNEWAERSRNDAEIGGEKFTQTCADIARVRDAFCRNEDGKVDPDIAEFINSPMGNHPGCLRLLARVGRAFGEARFPQGTGTGRKRVITADDIYQSH